MFGELGIERAYSSIWRVLMKLKFTFIIFLLGLTPSLVWANATAQLSFSADSVQLELSGEKNWKYNLSRKSANGTTQYIVEVPRLNPASVGKLEEFTSPLVKSVQVSANGTDGRHVLTLTVTGEVEAFDYLTDQPSRLIVDFYRPEPAKKPTAKATTNKNEKPKAAAKPVTELPAKQDPNRSPANDVLVLNDQALAEVDVSQAPQQNKKSGIFDGADPGFERFTMKDYDIKEDAIIASGENVYLNFPSLKVDSERLHGLLVRKPVYSITQKEGDENKQARLLLTLFQNKRYNVFLKAVQWFVEKYPNSEYDEIVRFMWADTHYALYSQDKKAVDQFDLAMLRYRQVLEKYPQSELAERTQMLMSFATLDRGDYLQTLRMFLDHLRKRPQSANRDISLLAIADTYARLSRFKEAEESYNEVETHSPDPRFQAEAAYLKGDVYFQHAQTLHFNPEAQRQKYAEAIKQYQDSLKKYDSYKENFPNALYNQAAAYFWNKDYVKSLEAYRNFLVQFPSHDYSGYAMTRVGELLAILGADSKKVTGAYLETYFRYGNTPSAVVARLRMLSERMKNMKPKEVEKAVSDIKKLSLESKLPDIEQFATILISDGYNSRKEYSKSVDLLVSFYQANPMAKDLEPIRKRIVRNINQELTDLVEAGKFIPALQLHNKYAGTWLKNSPRIDTRFLVGRAYEQAGVYKDSEVIYREVLNRLYALQGTEEEKQRSVLERLPTTDELNLRLSSIAFHQNKLNEAYDFLRVIKAPAKMSEAEQIERIQMTSYLLDQRGETAVATRYLTELIQEWKGQPQLVADPFFTLAKYEIKLGKPQDAVASLKRIDQLQQDTKMVNPSTHSAALELLATELNRQGNKKDSIQAFEKLLDQYENQKPLSSMRYQLGQIHFDLGEIKKAEDVWSQLKGKQNDVWYNLAQEQLSNTKWKDEYNKYIQRIPAMSERN